jgi:Tfp pilus assembly protein PilN
MRTAKLHLEFAPGSRRVPWSGRVLLLAGLASIAIGVFQLSELWMGRSRAAAELRTLDERGAAGSATRPLMAKADAKQVAGTKALRQVSSTLMTPWAGLLSSLGAAPTGAVALLAVEPSVNKHSVRLTAEARDLHEMLDYVGALQRDERLSSVVLVSHQVQVQAPGTPVRFQIHATWGDAR